MAAQGRPVEHDLPVGIGVSQEAKFVGTEGLHSKGAGLGHVPAALDLVIQHRQHPQAGGIRAGGGPHRVQQIQVGIGAERRGRPHGPGYHHRFGGFDGQVEKIGGLLQSGGAVGNDYTRHIRFFPEDLVDPPGQSQPFSRADGGAAHADQVFRPHFGDVLNLRNTV